MADRSSLLKALQKMTTGGAQPEKHDVDVDTSVPWMVSWPNNPPAKDIAVTVGEPTIAPQVRVGHVRMKPDLVGHHNDRYWDLVNAFNDSDEET